MDKNWEIALQLIGMYYNSAYNYSFFDSSNLILCYNLDVNIIISNCYYSLYCKKNLYSLKKNFEHEKIFEFYCDSDSLRQILNPHAP